MFESVSSFKEHSDFTAFTPFEIIGNFLELAIVSIIIGFVAAILCSLLFKHVRLLTHSAIVETILMYIFAMVAYYTSESLQMSSIISLLVCGILMAHYTFFNLSPQGKTVTSVSF